MTVYRPTKVHRAHPTRPSFTVCGHVWRYQMQSYGSKPVWKELMKAVDNPEQVTCKRCSK